MKTEAVASGSVAQRLASTLGRYLTGSEFARSVVETVSTRFVLILIGLVTSVIVARILGPEGRGLYAVATTLGALGVQFGNLGLHASNTYYVARSPSQLPTLLGNTLVVCLLAGSVTALGLWAASVVHPPLAPVHGWLFLFALGHIPLGLAYLLLQNLLLGTQRVRAYNAVELGNRILAVMLVAVAIVLHAVTVESVFIANLAALTVAVAAMTWWLVRASGRPPCLSWNLFRAHLPFGLRAYSTDFFAFVALRISLFVVHYQLGSEQVGYFAVASGICDLAYIIPTVIGTILFPRLAALDSAGARWDQTKKAVIATAWQMGTICLGFAAVAPVVIRLLYGESFIPAVPIVHLGLVATYLLAIQTILVKFLASSGYPLVITQIWLLLSAISGPTCFLWIRSFGLPGAMLSGVTINGVLLAAVFAASLRHLRRHRVLPAEEF